MQLDPMWGFQFLLILDLWGISFHAVIIFGLSKNLLFKSALGHCVLASISGSKLGQVKSYRLKSLYITDLTYLEQQSG